MWKRTVCGPYHDTPSAHMQMMWLYWCFQAININMHWGGLEAGELWLGWVTFFKSKAMVLNRKQVETPSGRPSLCRMEDLKYLGVMFTNHGKMINPGVRDKSDELGLHPQKLGVVLVCCSKIRVESKDKTPNLLVHLHFSPQLWWRGMDHDWKNEIPATSCWNELPL